MLAKLNKHDIFIRRIKRMIELSDGLFSNEVNVSDFCKKHSISTRTFMRDIEVLKHVNDIDICYNNIKNSYYFKI